MGLRGQYLLALFLGVILYILLRDGHEMSLGIWATALAVLPCQLLYLSKAHIDLLKFNMIVCKSSVFVPSD